MAKILWISDSTLFMTGFSTESKELCKRLTRAGHEVFYLGHGYAGQTLKPKGNKPAACFEDGEELPYTILSGGKAAYNADVLQPYIKKLQPDILGTLLDTFMVMPWYPQLDFTPAKTTFWFPSDGGWFPAGCETVLKKCNFPVAMAKFGQAQLKNTYGIDVDYIPHGVMSDHYFPFSPEKKEAAKAKWNIQGKFVVGCVSRNQGRKMLDRQMKAFALFAKDKNDVVMLMHSDPGDVAAATNLPNLSRRFGFENKIIWSGMSFFNAFTTEQMRDVYNAMDVHFLTTSGEGFGIPFIEAMACGVPNVATDYTTTKELITDWNAGLGIPLVGEENIRPYPSEQIFDGTLTGTYDVDRGMCSIKKAAELLQYMYDNPKERIKMGQNGRKAVFAEYDWETQVWPRWRNKINQILEY